jgi:hypothetical protein
MAARWTKSRPVNSLLALLALVGQDALVQLDELQKCLGCCVIVTPLRIIESLACLRESTEEKCRQLGQLLS